MTRSLVRWSPHNVPFANPVSRLFDEAFNNFLSPVADSTGTRVANWAPPVDIREEDDKLLFIAEVPGLSREQIEITLEDQVLTLSGERKFDGDEENDRYHRVERAYGTFSRSFKLPTNVDPGTAETRAGHRRAPFGRAANRPYYQGDAKLH